MHGREAQRDLQQHGRHEHRAAPEQTPAPGPGRREQSEREQRRTGDDGAEPVR